MAKYYYNGVLLPETPADIMQEYPSMIIGVKQSSGYYQLLATKAKFYHTNSQIKTQNTLHEPFLYCFEGDEVWTTGTSGNYHFEIDSDRIIIWSNLDIPNGSPSATDIYFYGTEPVPENADSGDNEGGDDEENEVPILLGDTVPIKVETLSAFANQARRLSETENELSTTEMLDIFSTAVAPENSKPEVIGLHFTTKAV